MNSKLKTIVTAALILMVSAGTVYAAGITTDPSRTTYGARPLGMGGAFVAYSDDANGIFMNPAGLTNLEFPQLTALSRKLFVDETQFSVIGWAMPSKYGTFGMGFAGMETGGSLPTVRDPSNGRIIINPSLEAMSNTNNVTMFTYANKLPVALDISLGASLKFFNQAIAGGGQNAHGTGTSIDLGAQYQPLNWLTLGAGLQNIAGGSVKWDGSEDKIGGYYKLGSKFNVLGSQDSLLTNRSHTLTAGFDIDLPHDVMAASNTTLMHVGVEYSPFNMKDVALRAGFNQEPGGTGLTLGSSITSLGFRFDYAYAPRPGVVGDSPHYFSLSYVGARTIEYQEKLKEKDSAILIETPKDKDIVTREVITVKGKALTKAIYDLTTIHKVVAISSTQETREIDKFELAQNVSVNGTLISAGATFETTYEVQEGRNVLTFTAEAIPEMKIISNEVRVLNFDPFLDVPETFWAFKPVALTSTIGLVKGYPDGTFKPDKGITRAELVTLLVRSLGVEPETGPGTAEAEERIFKDVAPTHWADSFINYGAAHGLVTGYPDGTFKPGKVLNRAEGITVIARFAKLVSDREKEIGFKGKAPFSDLSDDFWANIYIDRAKGAGLIVYLSGKASFEANAPFTRAEACEVLSHAKSIELKIDYFWDTGMVSAQTVEKTEAESTTAETVTIESPTGTIEAVPLTESATAESKL